LVKNRNFGQQKVLILLKNGVFRKIFFNIFKSEFITKFPQIIFLSKVPNLGVCINSVVRLGNNVTRLYSKLDRMFIPPTDKIPLIFKLYHSFFTKIHENFLEEIEMFLKFRTFLRLGVSCSVSSNFGEENE